MNLLELRNKVKNITDYNPEVQTYLDDLDELINDAYANVYMAKRWNFANQLINLNIYPDIVKDANHNVNCALVDGRRLVTFTGAIPEFMEDPRQWEGQIIELYGVDYTIMQIQPAGAILTLTEPFRGTTTTGYTEWRIKHRWYRLPQDCVEVLSLCHRDAPVPAARPVHGKQIGLVRRRDEELNLRIDRTSTFSEAYVLVPPQEIPAAMKFGAITITGVSSPPGSGIFLANQSWEFAWAFQKQGRIGPLSEPKVVSWTTIESNTFIRLRLYLQTWDDRPVRAKALSAGIDIYPSPFEGWKKVLFYNSNYDHTIGERRGLPCWRMVAGVGPIAGGAIPEDRDDWQPMICADTLDYFEVDNFRQLAEGCPRYVEWDGQWERIRPYPRPQGFDKEYLTAAAGGGTAALWYKRFRQFQLRYLGKPEKLQIKTDTPKMPYEFHQLIIYSVLFEAFTKSNNTAMAVMYDKKISDTMKTLEKRYVDRTDVFWRRGQFGVDGRSFPYDYASLRKLN